MTDFFDDLCIDDTYDLGAHTFSRDEILRFAEKYDPQPFHLSEEAAAETHYGRVIASGWHTASVFMQRFVATLKASEERARADGKTPARFGPSPGFEKLRWIKPVYPGDTLSYSQKVTGKTESRSRPEWGIVHSDMLAHNQDGELVFSFKAIVFVERRGS
ncbi:MaoC family dehydratase [Rhodobacterales bacterium]|nr:MaoC family dehydratase [Rhodobacterales bacterium]